MYVHGRWRNLQGEGSEPERAWRAGSGVRIPPGVPSDSRHATTVGVRARLKAPSRVTRTLASPDRPLKLALATEAPATVRSYFLNERGKTYQAEVLGCVEKLNK